MAAGMRTHVQLDIRPAKFRTHGAHIDPPLLDHVLGHGIDAQCLQHRARSGEEQVGSGQAARVLEGSRLFHAQSSCSRVRWMPRSSRTTPSQALASNTGST